MMRVKIPDCDTFSAIRQCIERRDGNVVKITESHGAIARGVMSGRAHQRKRGLSMQCRARGFNGRAGGFFRILVDVWMSRRVEIEILGGRSEEHTSELQSPSVIS